MGWSRGCPRRWSAGFRGSLREGVLSVAFGGGLLRPDAPQKEPPRRTRDPALRWELSAVYLLVLFYRDLLSRIEPLHEVELAEASLYPSGIIFSCMTAWLPLPYPHRTTFLPLRSSRSFS